MEWKKFVRSGVGYAVNADGNVPAGMAEKTVPADFMGSALWLLVLAAVCLYGYHFYRCFRLYCWNVSWEDAYREKLETADAASHISTVPFPGW